LSADQSAYGIIGEATLVLRRLSVSGRAAGAALLASLFLAGGARAEEALRNFAQPALQDFTATGVVQQKDDAELRKIDKNYAQGYRFRESLIQYKEPMKLRVDSKAGLFSLRYVINGKRKSTQVPGLHINRVKDITGKPGEEQSMLDSGIITPGFLADNVASRFVGYQTLDKRKVPEFEFWYTDEPHSRHHFVWMDPAKRFILRHDVYNRSGGLKMRFVFKQPMKVAGVWVPTRVEVYNAEFRQAAVTRYTNVRVNTGLSESLFRI
jgi:hypothetical protein